jgi:hypothetical protein
MAAQIVYVQPLKRALGGNIYLELTEWNGSKRVDLRFWKDDTVPTKEGVSLHLDQWKTLCNMSDVTDVTIKAPFPFVHIRKHFIPAGE